jgi:hypothetical protein
MPDMSKTNAKTSVDQLLSETLVPLDEAHKLLPGEPKKRQLRWWCRAGIVSQDESGRKVHVKLESCRIGARPYTTQEAYKRFLHGINRKPRQL